MKWKAIYTSIILALILLLSSKAPKLIQQALHNIFQTDHISLTPYPSTSLTPTLTPLTTPTSTPTFIYIIQKTDNSNPLGQWAVPIIVVLISGCITLIGINFQTRRNFKLEQEKQTREHQLNQEMLHIQQDIDEQYRSLERQRQRKEEEAIAALNAMRQAKNTKSRAKAYRDTLWADPRIANLQILDMNHPLEVANVYVQVRLHQETRNNYELEQDLLIAEAQHDPNLLIQANQRRLEKLSSQAMDPEEAIRIYKRCVIVGDPGAGKTTLLKYLTLKSAARQMFRLPDLPIYVELNAFAYTGNDDLLDFISTIWDERYGFPKAEAQTFIEQNLRSGNALVLLDALDETVIGETNEIAEASYRRVAECILQIATRYHKVPIVVTARKAGYHQRARLKGFTELEVLDFSPRDIQEFVYNWFSTYSNPQKRANAEDLDEKLWRNPRIQSLASNPLLLSLIVIVYEAQLDLPDRRAELYKQCIDTLLTKWDASRNIRRRREFKPEHKRHLLEEIAWHFHNQGQRYFPENELLNVIADFLPAIRVSAEKNRQVLEEIAAENGLLKEQAQHWHGFLHLTLQEYFVAQYISDNNLLESLLRHLGDPWWEEITLLYAGQTADASRFLHMLIEANEKISANEDIFYTNFILAGRCLAARPTIRQISLRDEIIDHLFDIFLKTPYKLNQEQIANVLAEIGGAEINSRLLSLLSNSQFDLEIRKQIAISLGNLGERSIAPDLLPLLSDSEIPPDIRIDIADAIGTLGEQSVVPRLLTLLSDTKINLEVRKRIVNTLGDLGDRSIAPKLVTLLSDSEMDLSLRGFIAYSLGKLREQSVAVELLPLLFNVQIDLRLRKTIASTLRRLKERSIAQQLLSSFTNSRIEPVLLAHIAYTLGSLGEQSVVPRLLTLLSDTKINLEVRKRIADALGNLRDRSIAPKLVTLLSDSKMDLNLRKRIAYALIKIDEPSVIPQLQILLYDTQIDPQLYVSIANALFNLGDQSFIPKLLDLLSDSRIEANIRIRIVETIGNLGDQSIASKLVTLLSDSKVDLSVRKHISSALGSLGERAIAPQLVHLLTDIQLDLELRRLIADLIGELGERSVAHRMLALLNDSQIVIETKLRENIIIALGKLGEQSVASDILNLISPSQPQQYLNMEPDELLESDELLEPDDSIYESDVYDIYDPLPYEDGYESHWSSIVEPEEASVWNISLALEKLDDQTIMPDLIELFRKTQDSFHEQRRILNTITHLAKDETAVYQIVMLLKEADPIMSDSVFNALWTICRKVGVRVFLINEKGEQKVEIVKW